VPDGELATADGPVRRRESWSLRTIVENVAGRPIDEFQDPARPVHPYVAARMGHLPPMTRPATADEPETDPVDRVSPPLAGAIGRRLHGPDHEHHAATLRSVERPTEAPSPGARLLPPGPSKRPERVYLHYLLLHMDRLSDHALAYLQAALDEEMAHRASPPPSS